VISVEDLKNRAYSHEDELSTEAIEYIKELHKELKSSRKTGAALGFSHSQVMQIVTGKRTKLVVPRGVSHVRMYSDDHIFKLLWSIPDALLRRKVALLVWFDIMIDDGRMRTGKTLEQFLELVILSPEIYGYNQENVPTEDVENALILMGYSKQAAHKRAQPPD